MSGLTINFHKSDIYLFGEAKSERNLYQEIFTCALGEMPLKYLGLPVHNKRIGNSMWRDVTENIEKYVLAGRADYSI